MSIAPSEPFTWLYTGSHDCQCTDGALWLAETYGDTWTDPIPHYCAARTRKLTMTLAGRQRTCAACGRMFTDDDDIDLELLVDDTIRYVAVHRTESCVCIQSPEWNSLSSTDSPTTNPS